MWTPDGWFRVYERDEWPSSRLVPYVQFFYRRYALHGSRENLHTLVSHGCVNMSLKDGRHPWQMLTYGDLVYIWGTGRVPEREPRKSASHGVSRSPQASGTGIGGG